MLQNLSTSLALRLCSVRSATGLSMPSVSVKPDRAPYLSCYACVFLVHIPFLPLVNRPAWPGLLPHKARGSAAQSLPKVATSRRIPAGDRCTKICSEVTTYTLPRRGKGGHSSYTHRAPSTRRSMPLRYSGASNTRRRLITPFRQPCNLSVRQLMSS